MFTGKLGPITGELIRVGRLKSSSLCLCQTFRYWGRCKENKTKKTLLLLMLYFSLSEHLEQVVISYIAVLSYLGQRHVE